MVYLWYQCQDNNMLIMLANQVNEQMHDIKNSKYMVINYYIIILGVKKPFAICHL